MHSKLETIDVKPFLKWPGGKRQLLSYLEPIIPYEFDRYFEPFLGGGAILFHLLSRKSNLTATVSDVNPELMNCYRVIKYNVSELITELKIHQKKYMKNREKYYYKIRNEFESKDKVESAARFIFLNKTCFNGLYRVNRSGKFNVPLGSYSSPNIVNDENLEVVSKLLNRNKITFKVSDFFKSLESAKSKDFVFLDPPYFPSCKSVHSTHYWSEPFVYSEHERLKEEVDRLDSKGVKIILTNSDTPETRKIFKDYMSNSIKVNGVRVISSSANTRSGHKQLIIKNF